jgi:hypothetical protein
LIESGFVDGGVQFFQRIVDDFEFDNQDLLEAKRCGEKSNEQRENLLKCVASSLIDATTIKLRRTRAYLVPIHIQECFYVPQNLEKNDDQWGAVCIHWVTRAECDAYETIRTFEGSLTPASQEV